MTAAPLVAYRSPTVSGGCRPSPDIGCVARVLIAKSPREVAPLRGCTEVARYRRRGWGPSDLADLEVDELRDRHTRFVEQCLDRLLGVEDRGLLEQDIVLEVPVHAALDDLGQGLLGLAVLARLGLGHPALGFRDIGRNLVAGEITGTHGGDLHRCRAGGVGVAAVELDQDPNLRRQILRLAVQVGGHLAVELRRSPQFELLANDRGQGRDTLRHGLAVSESLSQQRVDITGRGRGEVRDDVARKRLELLVLSHEIGLRSQLDHRTLGGSDQPVGGYALLPTLGSLGLTLDSQDLQRLVELAIGLHERLLALHHPGAGGVAELLHIGGGELGHFAPRRYRTSTMCVSYPFVSYVVRSSGSRPSRSSRSSRSSRW